MVYLNASLQLFFLNSCQPKGYISEGKSTIVTKSIESATLQMITNQRNSAAIYNDLDSNQD